LISWRMCPSFWVNSANCAALNVAGLFGTAICLQTCPHSGCKSSSFARLIRAPKKVLAGRIAPVGVPLLILILILLLIFKQKGRIKSKIRIKIKNSELAPRKEMFSVRQSKRNLSPAARSRPSRAIIARTNCPPLVAKTSRALSAWFWARAGDGG
jgi:hypothetical protein